jgi:hypothetical protein
LMEWIRLVQEDMKKKQLEYELNVKEEWIWGIWSKEGRIFDWMAVDGTI